jgi:hypothetical protein
MMAHVRLRPFLFLLLIGCVSGLSLQVQAQRRSAVATLAAAVSQATENPELTGDAAEQAGRFQTAFFAYLNAFQSLTDPRLPSDDQRLREKIIKVVQKMEIKPLVPQSARTHLEKADSLLKAESVLGSGGAATQQAAAAELRQAVLIAPWWPDATFRLATVLQKLQRLDEALLNLSLYKLADPAGYLASAEKANPPKVEPPSSTQLVAPAEKREPLAGMIHVYRPGKFQGSAARAKVECNGQKTAELQNDRFVILTAMPGTHALKIGGREFTLEVEGGHEYYFRTSSGMRGWTVRGASPEEARAEMQERSLRPGDANRIYSTECRASLGAVRQSR